MTGPVQYHQVAFEKGDSGTFNCHICTRSHGYTHVSRCQRRGIIHTVSGHRNHMARLFQSGYHCFFAIRQNSGFNLIYSQFPCDCFSSKLVIPGEHNDADPRLTQSFKRIRRGCFHGIRDSYQACKVPVCGHIDNGSAFHPQRIRNGLLIINNYTVFLHSQFITNNNPLTFDIA
ncbi:Uncharacterised protein [Enterobacter hormaechei]|nr:Uncharacterised protein [Enterobacter hormaechei]